MSIATLKLTTKLTSAFVGVCVLGATVGLLAIRSMAQMNAQADVAYRENLIGISLTKEANIDLMYIGRALRDALLATGDAQRNAAFSKVDDNLALTRQNLDKAKPLYVTDKGKTAFAVLDRDWMSYESLVKKFKADVAAGPPGANIAATKFLYEQALPVAQKLDAQMTLLTELKESRAKAELQENDELYQQARNRIIGTLAASLALGVGIGWWLARGVTRQLGGEPAEAAAVARRVADGDLSTAIALAPGTEGSVMAAFKEMQTNLGRVVLNVRQNSESVATASAQIAQGNQDLSGRTEEQASALQQTAATMEQLGTTVRHNAESARQANQLAQSASGVAEQGGAAVGEVVQTMKGINDSSRKIADIISVIDGIAFQTNILALNAAVEAARAGEQGRGFAVVASEVRSLAQRSAAAAKEIKTLITHSVEQVEQGSTQVDRAGQTMAEIVGAIRRVSDIVAEISAASAEQSSGVSQVGEAVSQMDQATQQNAALVEESAAAAESLKGQALQLVQAVAVFKLGSPEALAAS